MITLRYYDFVNWRRMLVEIRYNINHNDSFLTFWRSKLQYVNAPKAHFTMCKRKCIHKQYKFLSISLCKSFVII